MRLLGDSKLFFQSLLFRTSEHTPPIDPFDVAQFSTSELNLCVNFYRLTSNNHDVQTLTEASLALNE